MSDKVNHTDAALSPGEADCNSAEGVIKAYLAGLRDQDFGQMLDTFDKEGLPGSSDETGTNPPGLPEEFLQKAAVMEREGEIADEILRQYRVLCQMDSDGIEEEPGILSEQIGAANLPSLKILGFISQESMVDAIGSDAYKKYTGAQAKRCGMDQIGAFMPVIELDGKKYSLIFEAAERDGRWFILHLGGFYAAMASLDADAAGTALLDSKDEKWLDQLMVPTGELPQPAGMAEAEGKSMKVVPEGFDTPEMAAESYLDRFKAYDLAGMLDTFAVADYAYAYGFSEDTENIDAADFMQQENPAAALNDAAGNIMIRIRKAGIQEDIIRQYSAVSMINGSFYGNKDDTQKESGTALDLASLKVHGAVPPETLSEVYGTDGSRNLLAKQAKQAGADRVESCAVTFEFGGGTYVFCADAVEYGGRWYLKQLGGHLAGLSGISYELMGIWPFDAQGGADAPEAGKTNAIGKP